MSRPKPKVHNIYSENDCLSAANVITKTRKRTIEFKDVENPFTVDYHKACKKEQKNIVEKANLYAKLYDINMPV